MNHPVCILISVFAVIACAACSERGGVKMPAPPPDPNAGVARYELQRVMAEPLIGEEGAIAVKETPDGDRLISIGFRRFRSTAARPSDPVFLLPGGPGGSYNERLDEDGDRQAQALALVELFRRVGDVVLVDLRGVYLSTPHLVCGGAPNKLTLIKSATKLSEITRKAADACRSKLLREGVDLAGYTPIQAAQDVIAVADHLGYENIRLYGRSFGSHWALTLAKYFPERISRMVIEGVEGLDHTYDDHHSVLSAIERISADAKTAWSGFRGFNEPVDVYRTVHKNARASSRAAYGLDPLEVSLWMLASHDHSLTARSGMSDWLPVTKDLAKGKAWPIKIRRPFIASYIGIGWDAAAVGLFDCASSISQARRDRLSLTNQESILYTDLQSYDALCEAWDIDALPNEFRKDVSSSIPVLAFSGDFDVSTPIENAEAVMPLFENGYFVRVRRGSHNAMFEAMNERPELGNEIVSWLNGEDGPPKLIELPSPFAANDDNP